MGASSISLAKAIHLWFLLVVIRWRQRKSLAMHHFMAREVKASEILVSTEVTFTISYPGGLCLHASSLDVRHLLDQGLHPCTNCNNKDKQEHCLKKIIIAYFAFIL